MLKLNKLEIQKEKDHDLAEFNKRRGAAKFNIENHVAKAEAQ